MEDDHKPLFDSVRDAGNYSNWLDLVLNKRFLILFRMLKPGSVTGGRLNNPLTVPVSG